MTKSEDRLRNLFDTIKWNDLCIIGVPEGVERKDRKHFKRSNGRNLLKPGIRIGSSDPKS
jgi:hypothetical protein